MPEIKIIAQSGSRFLADLGDPPNAQGHAVARIYDRETHVLHQPFAVASIAARGYWTDPELDDATRERILSEISELATAASR